MPEWLVGLTGRERDVRSLATGVREPWLITEEDSKFYLRSSHFQGLGDAREVQRLAEEFVHWADLAALARFEGYQSVRTAEIVGLEPNGSRHVAVTPAVGRVEAGDVFEAPVRGSQPAPPPDLNKDTALLRRRPLLATAFKYIRGEPGWYGYLKATEALGEEIGGKKNIVSHGWATEDEFKRFVDTVHHHRHHRKPAPPNPMKKHEAKRFLLGLLRSCVDWRLSQGR